MTVNSGGTIYVEPGATLEVDSTGILNINTGSNLTVYAGGSVPIETGGVLSVGTGEVVSVYSGGSYGTGGTIGQVVISQATDPAWHNTS